MFDPQVIKKDFPILNRKVNGKPLIYLDSGATSQKPASVLLAEREYYEKSNANVHRGAHALGDEATQLYGDARDKVANFIGAKSEEVIFVRNTTEAINLVAYSWGRQNLQEGDVVLTTMMEHHANLVPWQEAVRRVGGRIEAVSLSKDGLLDMEDYQAKLKLKPKLVAMVQVSNALGTINPVAEMTKMAHKAGAIVLIDGAQALPHMKVNMSEIGCDFYAFSGHKMLGPMGIGVLWGRKALLEQMPPFLVGGGMINEVEMGHSTWADLPDKFEAGTPNVAGAVGLMAAVQYLENLGMEEVRGHDKLMTAYCIKQLEEMESVRIIGTTNPDLRCGSVSFEYLGVHAHDIATILDSEGVAVRSGHHCTMPLHKYLGLSASVRASFNIYTTKEDVDALRMALGKVKNIFKK